MRTHVLQPLLGPALVLGGILLGACGGGGEAPAPTEPAGDAPLPPGTTRLTFEAPNVDLGTVWEGEELVLRFRGRVGRGDLNLAGLKPDCGCATPVLSVLGKDGPLGLTRGAVVPADSEVEMLVRYDTQGRIGKQPRKVSLFGNVPDGVVRVEFVAEVRPWLIAEPKLADLGRLRPGDERGTSFEIRGVDDSPVGLRLGEAKLPKGVAAELVPLDPDAEGRATGWRLDVEAGSGLPRGKHRMTFPLVSDRLRPDADDGDERTFETSVTLLAEGAGRLSLRPDVIRLGTLAPDTTVARTVRLSVHEPGLRLKEPVARLVPATTEDLVRLGSSGGDHELTRTLTITPRPVPGQPAWDLELLVRGLDPEVPTAFAALLEVETGFEEEPVLHALVQGIRSR